MTAVQEKLFSLADEKYASFQAKLTPNIAPDKFIGVRLPALRAFAREFEKSADCAPFLAALPHEYYDENMLHSILIGRMKDIDSCLAALESFLPYVDNWAVCDSLSPKVFAKHGDKVLPRIIEWANDKKVYTCRFGIDMLMTFYLDNLFQPEYLEMPARADNGDYYVRMAVAWYFATALAKQWDASIKFIEQRRLPDWTHRKAIQKAIESYRITDEQKAYLRTLK